VLVDDRRIDGELEAYQAQLVVPGRPTSHLLHFMLTILTAGVWLPVWLVAFAWPRRDRLEVVTMDEYGQVLRS
jgi:hypothetical protein